MAKFVGCPSCQASVDVGPFKPGTVVACPGCESHIKVPGAAPPAPPPRSKTPVMRKAMAARTPGIRKGPPRPRRARPQGNPNQGMMIGGGIAGVVALIVVIVAVNSKKEEPKKEKKPPAESAVEAPAPPPVQEGFEKGAQMMAGKAEMHEIDPALGKVFSELALAGRYSDLITPKDAIGNLKIALMHLIGDDEKLARAGWGYIEAFFSDKRIKARQSGAKPPTIPGDFNKAERRSAFYAAWGEWPTKQKNVDVTNEALGGVPAVAEAGPTGTAPPKVKSADPDAPDIVDPAAAKEIDAKTWESWMPIIREGALEGEHAEIRARIVKSLMGMGKKGIEKLIENLTVDDIGMAMGCARALNDIVMLLPPERGGGKDRVKDEPRAKDVEAVREAWREWLKTEYKDPK